MPPPRNLYVVVPVFNERDNLPALVAEVSRLRRNGASVVLVDGGSADGSLLALQQQLSSSELTSPQPGFAQAIAGPRGRAAQMNAGVAWLRDRVGPGFDDAALLFLHADTRLPSNAVALIMQSLQTRVWGRFDVVLDGKPMMLRVVATMMNLRSRLTGIATGDQAIFVRAQAFARVGGFANQPLMEDIALSKALKTLGWPACLRQRLRTSGRRWEQHGVWQTIVLMWQLRWAYWRGVPATELAKRYRPHQPRVHIAVLANVPLPGRAKTRLIPAVGAQAAAALAQAMLLHSLEAATASGASVSLWLAGDPLDLPEEILSQLPSAIRTGLRIEPQPAGDLGAKMAHIMTAELRLTGTPVMLIGTDIPAWSAPLFRTISDALNRQDVDLVLAPTHDGGYGLIGAKSLPQALLTEMPWSTPEVLPITVQRANAEGLRLWMAQPVHDIDVGDDLVHIPASGRFASWLTTYHTGTQPAEFATPSPSTEPANGRSAPGADAQTARN